MLNLLNRPLIAAIFLSTIPSHSFAEPATGRLLALIPAEATVVAGVEDPHNPDTGGHHLLVTVPSSFDLDDWLSITGVDSTRTVDRLIWLAASSTGRPLSEHALLVAGRFDREHIFRAAKQNGASTTFYGGIEALLVAPLPREHDKMQDLRWLAILDGQSAVFGTPWLVQRIIDRSAAHASTDPILAGRLARLHANVNSWNLIALPADAAARRAAISQLPSPWSELLDGAGEVTLGTRYGSTVHLDLSVELPADRVAAPALPGEVIPRMVKASWFESAQTRVENLAVVAGRVEGSLALPRKQFDACFRDHSSLLSPSLALNAK
jgi:hypothetical protein